MSKRASIFLLGLMIGVGTIDAQPVDWLSLPEALTQAAMEERPTLVYVRADWCGPCLRMERDVFPEVAPLLHRFARAELDFDDHETRWIVAGVSKSPFAWAQHFGAEAPPALILLDAQGQPITRVTGFIDTDGLSLLLTYVATGAHRHSSFAAYAAQVSGDNR